MTAGLKLWLGQATRHLSKDSAAQVRSEIQEHYESALDAAVNCGNSRDHADTIALAALGDATTANRQYRKVLLTSGEARLLREGNWEAKTFCARRLARTLTLSMPGLVMLIAVALFLMGATGVARIPLIGAIGMALLFLARFLPIYTPSRSRIFRYVKWVILAAMPILAFGAEALKFSWLLIACLWPVAWVEWTRISIRRKLPVSRWPRQLYL